MKSLLRFLSIIFIAFFGLQALPANAELTAPSISNTGNYDVSFDNSSSFGYLTLRENGTVIYANVPPTGRYIARNKPAGTYVYSTYWCIIKNIVCFSDSTTVIVDLTPTTPSFINLSNLSHASNNADNNGSYGLNWSASTNATSYRLEQKTNSGSWILIHNSNSRSKSVSGLSNASYHYRVKACNGSICSGYTSVKTINVALTPGVPASINTPGTSYTGSHSLHWGASSGSVTKYELYQQKNGGSFVLQYTGTARSKGFSGLGTGSYLYRIRACRTTASFTSCSGYRLSGMSSVTIPGAPTSFNVPSTSNNEVYTVSWSGVTGASRYELARQINGGSWSLLQSTSAASRSESSIGNGSYSYRIRACSGLGCSGFASVKTINVALTPGVPASINTPGTSYTGSHSLRWGASSGSVTKYELYQQKNGGSFVLQYIGTARSKGFSGLGTGSYLYRIRACRTTASFTSCSGYRLSGMSSVTIPGAPTSFNMPSTSNNGVYTVSWGGVTGASYYELARQINGGSWSLLQSTSAASRSEASIGNGSYGYRIRACSGLGCSGFASVKTINVALTPSVPASINTPGTSYTGSHSLHWGASSGSVTKYELYQQKNAGSFVIQYAGTDRSKGFSGLGTGSYLYRIRACRTTSSFTSCSGYRLSGTSSVTIPSAPTSFNVPSTSDNGVYTVSWSGVTGASYYELARQINGGSWSLLQSTSAASRSESSIGNGSYGYRIRACSSLGCSGFSSVKTIDVALASGTPPSLTASPASSYNAQIALNWSASAGYKGFMVEKRYTSQSGAVGSWQILYTGSNTSMTETGLLLGRYQYRIRSYVTVGAQTTYSAYFTSNTATVKLPAVPQNLTTPTVDNDGAYTVSWQSSEGASRYELQRNLNNGTWSSVHNAISINKTESGLNNATYFYRVRACSTLGCSAFSSIANTDVALAPTMPTMISVTPISYDGQQVINWSAATGSVSFYEFEQKKDNGSYNQKYSGLLTSSIQSNLTAGTFVYRVRACKTIGSYTSCSSYKSSATGLVALPLAPTQLTVPATDSDGLYAINWSATSGANLYKLQRRKDNNNWQTIQNTKAVNHQSSGISDGVYQYKVSACSSVGCGDYSDIKTIVVSLKTLPKLAPAAYNAIGNLASLVSVADQSDTDDVGSVVGQFRVNEGGAATYSIPIKTAAGTAGVTPELSLNYSSSSHNGHLGLAWAIGGLNAISRCRQTLHQDAIAKPLTWTAQDRFCLNGQRLIVQDNAVYGASNTTYKTEINSFVTVTAVGGTTGHPSYFTVEAKDGSTSYYGDSVDSKQLNKQNDTLNWLINKIQDNVGNPMWFIYERSGDVNESPRIKEVRYAYGSSTEPTGYNAHIVFDYDERTDDISGYVAGTKYVISKRLSSVASYNGSQEIQRYNLMYLGDVGQPNAPTTDITSRLSSIEECVDSHCLPATEFTWSLPNIGFSNTSTHYINLTPMDNRGVFYYRPADINGDGKQDIVWLEWVLSNDKTHLEHQIKYALSDGNRFTRDSTTTLFYSEAPSETGYAGTETVKFDAIDYNADGRFDLIVYNESAGKWRVHLSEPQSDGSWKISSVPIDTVIINKNTQFMDVNSDGLVDALTYDKFTKQLTTYILKPLVNEPVTSAQYYAFEYDNQVSFTYQLPSARKGSNRTYSELRKTEFFPGVDVNFDGRSDLIVYTLWRCQTVSPYGSILGQCYVPDGNSSSQISYLEAGMVEVYVQGSDGSYSSYFSQQTTGVKPKVADFNNDGLVDLLIARDNGVFNSSDAPLLLNTGESFQEVTALTRLNGQLLDYNLDGFPDLIWHDSVENKIKVRYWQSQTLTFSDVEDVANAYGTNDTRYQFFDFSGDGITDYLRFDKDKLLGKLGDGTQDQNLITNITNGLGNETDISYEKLSMTNHYQRIDVKTSQQCQTINITLPLNLGSVNKEYCTTSADDFYQMLNGDWLLPNGSQSLAKQRPVLEIHGPMNVVTRVDSSAPLPGNSEAKSGVEYYYGEAKIQASGRGFLGFQQLITKDMQTHVETTTIYRQDWPFIGLPLRTEVRTSQGNILSSAKNTWQVKGYQSDWGGTNGIVATSGTASIGAVHPYIEQATEISYQLANNGAQQGIQLTTVTTEHQYDDYGNVTELIVTTQDNTSNDTFVSKTVNRYGSSEYDLSKGRLAHTTVEKTRGAEVSIRTASFTYYASSDHKGLLETETTEPDDATLTLIKTNSYDDFGNKVGVKLTGGGKTRCDANTTFYDSTGRYVDEMRDCRNRLVSKVISRNSFGAPTQVNQYIDDVGIKHVATHYAYTDKGIRYAEASNHGAWQATTMHLGEGSHCPAGSIYYSQLRQAGGGSAQQCFDVLGRKTRKVKQGFDGNKIYQDIEYDNLGQLTQQSEPYYQGNTVYWTSFEYDTLRRVIKTTLPDNSIGTMAYNGFSQVSTNDKLHQHTEIYNALGEIIESVDNNGNTIIYRYDAQGNMDETEDSAGNLITMIYDLLGRKKSLDDPNKGLWTYLYNNFGELTQQTDAKNQTITNSYDDLGRLSQRMDRTNNGTITGNTSWIYDSGANGLGKLKQVTDSVTGYSKQPFYDALGRAYKTVTHLGTDGSHYEKVTFDQYSRIFQVFDAARESDNYDNNGIEYVYNTYGYQSQLLDSVSHGGQQKVYQTIISMNARGNITGESRSNGVISDMDYYEETGRIKRIYNSNQLLQNFQDLQYEWDSLGNLKYRKEFSANKNFHEDFSYDNLNRLTHYNIVGGLHKEVRYDELGNIRYKSDVCTGSSDCYNYGNSAGPHAVTSVNGKVYQYDSNGNNVSGDGRTINYTSFNKISQVSKGEHTTEFFYGAGRKRYKRIDTNASGSRTTLYIGSVEKIQLANGDRQVKRYIGNVAIITEHKNKLNKPTQLPKLSYIYRDVLGSIDIITDDAGSIIDSLSFDAWGQRRNATTWADISEALRLQSFGVLSNADLITTRGYTGHEMVDEVGIIHMNGRIYDPTLGRFLQADPIIQAPTDSQSYNRYTYVRNNPLSLTDPSGYSWLSKKWKQIKPYIGAIAAVVVAIYCQACGATMWNAAMTGAAIGGGSAAINGGNIVTGALAGAFSAAAFYGVGQTFDPGTVGNVLGNASVGGIMSDLQGGNFGHGFFAAGFAAAAKPAMYEKFGYSPQNAGARVVTAAVIGGTASVISGGKFANGAMTGAFSQMFNGESYAKRKWGQIKTFAKNAYDNYLNSTQSVGVSFEMPWRVDGEWSSFGVEFGVVSQSILHPDGFDIGAYVMTTAGKSVLPWGDVKGTMDLTLSQGSISDFSGSGGIADVQTPWGGGSVARSNNGLWAGSISPGIGLGGGGSIYTTRAVSIRSIFRGEYFKAECSNFVCQ